MESIENLYNNLIGNPKKWVYLDYNEEEICKEVRNALPEFSDLFVPDKAGEIIQLLLKIGKKSEGKLVNNVNKLSCERKRHIVSLFFIGHILYDNIKIIRQTVDQQLVDLIFAKQDDKKDTSNLYSFFWLLLCLFHDLGYAYEENTIKAEEGLTIDEIYKKLEVEFYPSIYNDENLKSHDKYRLCKWGVRDHGIWGGRVFLNDMLQIKSLLGQTHIIDKTSLFCTGDIDGIYAYAAWIIMSHNLRYDSGLSEYTRCFKCRKLDDFICPKARCISLKSNPLLFLFCLADTIEPTKTLCSTLKNPDNDKDICKRLMLGFDNNRMSFNLERLTDYAAGIRYKKNILSMNDWLIDVSKELTIKCDRA